MVVKKAILPYEIEKVFKNLSLDTPPVYLVGGALRNHFLERENYDFDFVLSDGVKRYARQVADQINGDFYMLDDFRQTARVLFKSKNGKGITLDFATRQGEDIQTDLHQRDFTVNAMAINLADPGDLIDPLNGKQDLDNKILRSCSGKSLFDDSIRTIRGARLAIQCGLKIEKQTGQDIKKAAKLLPANSPERIRDEFFKILNEPKASSVIHLMIFLDLLDKIIPDLKEELGKRRIHSLFMNKMDLTLSVMENLEALIDLLCDANPEHQVINPNFRTAMEKLGKFHHHFNSHFSNQAIAGRSKRGLLLLSSIFRLTGSKDLYEEGLDTPEKQNINDMLMKQVERMALSNDEAAILEKIGKNQGRVHKIRLSSPLEYPKLIYHFFRECGDEGVDLCFLALADFMALSRFKIKQEDWLGEIETSRMLLEAWWEHRNEKIHPPALLRGQDIMRILSISSSPEVGILLERVSEQQALGTITNREQAEEYIRANRKESGETNHE